MSEEIQGRVRVADDVIASIAATAAREVEGVEGIDTHAGRALGRVLPGRAAHPGVRVEIAAEEKLRLEMYIRVTEGTVIRDAAAAVQDKVAEALLKMLGLEVVAVDVLVSDVVFRPAPA